MASNLTTAGATAIMSGADLTGLYLGLGTGQSASGLTGEFSGGSYARSAAGTMNKSGAVAVNASAVTLGPFSGTLGTASHWGLFTAASGGTCRWVGSLVAATDLDSGGTVTVSPGDLSLSFDTAS